MELICKIVKNTEFKEFLQDSKKHFCTRFCNFSFFRGIIPNWLTINVSTKKVWNIVGCPSNVGKQVMLNIAYTRCQRNKRNSVFWLAKMTLCVMTLRNFQPFVAPNVNSDGPTNGLLKGQSVFTKIYVLDICPCITEVLLPISKKMSLTIITYYFNDGR